MQQAIETPGIDGSGFQHMRIASRSSNRALQASRIGAFVRQVKLSWTDSFPVEQDTLPAYAQDQAPI